MNIIIACDSFKGSLSSRSVAAAIAAGLLRAEAALHLTQIPIADGGEGTVDAYLAAAGGERRTRTVRDPLGEPVEADYAILPDGTAVIEMAQASGLPLLAGRTPDPMGASTYGTGQLIRAALDDGCRSLLIGIGGSATTDGGAGMLQALGARFLNGRGEPLAPGGAALAELREIDLTTFDPRLAQCRVRVASDVTNPLCGPNGAAAVYAPQKGAVPRQVQELDRALAHYADVAERTVGRAIRDLPGAGAAGGLGAGLMAFCGAVSGSGIDVMLDAVHFELLLTGADLVITGEGRIDGQSAEGKVPVGVARRAKAYRKDLPVFALVGSIGPGARAVYDLGIDSIQSITPGILTLEQSMEQAADLVADAAERLMRVILASKRRPSVGRMAEPFVGMEKIS